jgi:hypothetical protein
MVRMSTPAIANREANYADLTIEDVGTIDKDAGYLLTLFSPL